MSLAILICTLPDRADKLKRLSNILMPQVQRSIGVTVHINDAGKSMPTGIKRNMLIEQSSSNYFVFIDDDDIISSHYVASICEAMASNPDVITFNGYMTTDGKNRQDFTIKLGSEYVTKDNHHYRWPNHLTPMRRDKVRQVHFPPVWHGEDYQWSRRINDLKLLKTSVHIDENLYHYDCISKRPHGSIRERRRQHLK